MPSFYEFFAGGGMVRAGLGVSWSCLFANDIDEKKAAAYRENWGGDCLKVADVAKVTDADLPGFPDLAWASFPCQDLSLAGDYRGLKGSRSSTFWPFWTLMKKRAASKKPVPVVVLENVCGAITSHKGKDFAAIISAMADSHYRVGAIVIDAVHFVPQSRPRLFIVGIHERISIPSWLASKQPDPNWHPANLVSAFEQLDAGSKSAWIWLRLPKPPRRATVLADIIEQEPQNVTWHGPAETKRLTALMNNLHLRKVEHAKRAGVQVIGGIYKRTRDGVQRAEIRFDDIAGCLRTPRGGSSRQSIMVVEGSKVRSRLLSPREAARLMGLPDSYILPRSYNDAYHLAGDGVVVPVVNFLAAHVLEPILDATSAAPNEVSPRAVSLPFDELPVCCV